MKIKALKGKMHAGNPHVRFDDGEVAPDATPRRRSLLYMTTRRTLMLGLPVAGLLLTVGCDRSAPKANELKEESQVNTPLAARQTSMSLEAPMRNSLSSGLMTNLAVALTSEKSHSSERTQKDLPEFARIPAGINVGVAPYADLGVREYENKMSHDMYMDATEVTFLKWRNVKEWAKTNGYEFVNGDKAPDFLGGVDMDKMLEGDERDRTNDKYPATGMTWYDCLKWCNARSEMDGLEPVYYVGGKPYKKGVHEPVADVSKSGWRLPTEDEWQYAARGGKVGLRFPWGNTISHKNASYSGMKHDGAYPYDQSEGEHPIYGGIRETPVASFEPNGYGLYDIVGNAQEFTQDSDGEWVTVCGGRVGQLAHFLQIQHHDATEKTARGIGFRAMRLATEKKATSETTITVNQEIVEKMAAAIKDSLRQPKSKMACFARNMATFPSWNKSLNGVAYSVGDYVCILHKSPPLDIDADSHRWQTGLGNEKYRARINEIRTSNLSYLHSLAVYDPAWNDGGVPIPCIVLTVEMSRSTDVPYVCAFTPDGHKNFGKSDSLSSDAGMLLNALAVISLAFDKTPDRIGEAEEGFALLKRMKDKPRGNSTTCAGCSGAGLVNGALCSRCKGWGKVSGGGVGKFGETSRSFDGLRRPRERSEESTEGLKEKREREVKVKGFLEKVQLAYTPEGLLGGSVRDCIKCYYGAVANGYVLNDEDRGRIKHCYDVGLSDLRKQRKAVDDQIIRGIRPFRNPQDIDNYIQQLNEWYNALRK